MFRCVTCGAKARGYFDRCFACNRFDTCVRQERDRSPRGVRLSELEPDTRGRLSIRQDWDEALGGGALEHTIVLVCGQSGAGKSTDMLSIAAACGTYENPSLYLASEWEPAQIAARGRVLGLRIDRVTCEKVHTIEDCEACVSRSQARVIVLDSWGELSPEPEALERLREELGRSTLFVILHATKEGDFSGPQRLLHKADALVWIEPDVLRVEKNWHGPPGISVARVRPVFGKG